ncbi:glycosyltransferase family 4 protein [Photobacterium sp. TY1-4]|uniref:glycosyltransferase family 4 protein n=1 Tax=Photobacterium sp. TY1-4 TaxID=2899122 RepID=UPI0021C07AA3|nr:glycosyltransferase family 4 protein [Photobacterium sp. TY1-4]UXI01457.1 glycosyltransferase family 4 protein [Photobacterium sp. TY1-4]
MANNRAVLHICLSKGWGGLEMYPIRTGKQLIDKGWKVLGLCIRGTRVAEGMREQGFEVFEINSKAAVLPQLMTLKRWLAAHHVNVIHCHKSGDVVVAALLDTVGDFKVIFTEHMGSSSSRNDLYHRWVYRHVDQVLSISNFTKQRNIKALPVPVEKIHRLWLGTDIRPAIDDPAQIATIREGLGIPPQAIVIGTVGRIDKGKGQRELLEAFLSLTQQHPALPLHLLIVGGLNAEQGSDDGIVAEMQQAITSSGMASQIHLVGFRRDTGNMLAAMDICAILSHQEAFGLTVIEAMAARKLILGASTGAVPEILGEHYPYITDPLDIRAITDTLATIVSELESLKPLSLALQQRAAQHFSTETHIAALELIYDER